MKWIGDRKPAVAALGAVLAAWLGLASFPLAAQTAISTDGVVESTSGGFKFPDGKVQTAAAVAGLAPVADTRRRQCFDAGGISRSCVGTGEDGELQAGVAWPTPRFTDNGDGTLTDNLTGLIWLKDANCPGVKTWQEALDWVSDLNTTAIACTDYTAMTFTDWRLPNIKEQVSLVDFSQQSPALVSGHPFVSVEVEFYWSSTTWELFPTIAWGVDLAHGETDQVGKLSEKPVWPVRGGQ